MSPPERSRPLHLTPAAMVQVMAGGLFGAAGRETLEQALPTAADAFPVATLVINLFGAFLLGVLLEALVRVGDDSGGRRRVRLVVGTGFLGAFTTYSTFAVEADLLVRAGRPLVAALYVLGTLGGGLVATATGIGLGAARTGRPASDLPVDPDVDADPS